MSFGTVVQDDFKNTRRSYVVLGVIGVLAALTGLIVYAVESNHPDAFRSLFDVSFFFFLVMPLILIPLTYLSIAGDRERGSIKHTLGLPNSRAEYVLGKFVSRASVAVTAVLLSTAVAAILGFALYTNPIDPMRFVWFAAISALFVASLTGIFVACSALTKRRSRAMFGVIFAYFVLGPFWFGFLPIVSLETVITFIDDTINTNLAETALDNITFSSPITAYLAGLEPVYEGVIGTGEYEMIDSNYTGGSDHVWAQNWYNWLVMAAWGVIPLAVSYVRFRVAELG
ncbi:MAG: ABC transporter permease [Halobacteriales archaeon]